jgi:ribokinase
MSRVLVIGNATVDVMLAVARLPRPGETLLADAGFRCAGGKGLNQAVAAARLRVPVTLLAPIGSDADGAFLRDALRGEALDTDWRVAPHPTDLSIVTTAADGENAIVSTASCARWLQPESCAAAAASLGAGDILVLQGNLTETATLAALEAAQAGGARVVFNTAPIAWDQRAVAARADIVVANEGEARELTGCDGTEAARRLVAAGAGAAIVTRGGADAVLAEGGRGALLPVAAVAVVDTAGAGDVTVGTLAGALALGLAPEPALRLALAAASLSVTRRGTTPSFPSAEEMRGLVIGHTALAGGALEPPASFRGRPKA